MDPEGALAEINIILEVFFSMFIQILTFMSRTEALPLLVTHNIQRATLRQQTTSFQLVFIMDKKVKQIGREHVRTPVTF